MRIESVRAFPIRVKANEKLVGGSFAYTHFQTVLVRAECDGVVGWGEAMTRFEPEATALLVRFLSDGMVGKEIERPESAWGKLWGELRVRGHTRGSDVEALSGLEIALQDAYARIEGLPVAGVLSKRAADSVEVYAGSLFASRGEMKHQVARAMEQGLRGAKVKVGFGVEKDLEILKGVRREWPDGQLIADANGAYSLRIAKVACEKFRGLGLAWFEEPLPSDEWTGYSELAGLGVPIGGGESWFHGDLAYALERRIVDVLEPSVSRCGGIRTEADAARVSAREGIGFSPMTGMNSGISIAASVHVAAAFPSIGVEMNPFENPLQNELVIGLAPPKGGVAQVPKGSGLGVEVDESYLRKHTISSPR